MELSVSNSVRRIPDHSGFSPDKVWDTEGRTVVFNIFNIEPHIALTNRCRLFIIPLIFSGGIPRLQPWEDVKDAQFGHSGWTQPDHLDDEEWCVRCHERRPID